MLTTALLSFGAGVAALLSPCTFPILPGVVASLQGGTHTTRAGAASLRVLLFAAGATVALVGSVALLLVIGLYVNFLAPPYSWLLGVVFIVAAAASVGWIKPPVRAFDVPKTAGFLRPFLLGFGLALVWLPCVGPTLGIVLGLGSRAESVPTALVLGFAYFLGLLTPIMLFGLIFVRATRGRRWAGRAGRLVSVLAAVGLAVTGVLLVTGAWEVFSRWLVSISPVLL